MTLEAAGTATVSGQERDIYYLSYTNRSTPDVTSYVGISAGTGVFAVSPTKVTTDNAYKLYIENAVNYWTAADGSTVSSNTPYRISSVKVPGSAAMLHYQIGRSKYNFGSTTTAAIPQTDAPQEISFLDFYRVITTVEQICGTGNETSYSVQLGLTGSMPAPALTLKTIRENGADVTPYVVDGQVTYKYEIEEGADILSIANDGTFTGIGEGTARVRVTLSDESARFFDVEEPFYMDVTVSNFIPMTLNKIDNPASLSSTDVVVFVSAKPFANGKGFVAARNDNAKSGVMFSKPVLTGHNSLPADMVLPVSTVDDLRQFCLSNAGGATTNILMQNSVVGNSRRLGAEKDYAIRYYTGTTANYSIVQDQASNGYFPKTGSRHLGFFNSTPPALGPQVSYETQVSELCHMADITTLVPMYFYKLNKLDATIEPTDSIFLNEGENATVSAILKALATNGEPAEATGATFVYQVVDANGAPFAAGEAPVSVDANGNVTALKPGRARIKVTVGGDFARYFNAEAAYCDVIVRTPVFMFLGDAFDDMEVEVFAGQSLTLPAASLRDNAENGNLIEDAAFTYMLADENYEPWYDADGNPVISDELLSVDPATGVISTHKGLTGDLYIIPVMTAETEKFYVLGGDAHHFLYHVTVNPPVEAEIAYEGGPESAYLAVGTDETAVVPSPVVTVDGTPVEGVTFKYTVIDPSTGEPYAEGEAPVTIDPVTGVITPVEGKSGTAKIAVSLSDEWALQYETPAIEYLVSVAASAPATANGPFATEYVRVSNLDELKSGEGFIMVSTDARGNNLKWVSDFERNGTTGYGTTASNQILVNPTLPEKLPAAWLNQSPCVFHITPTANANKYYLYFTADGQKTYMGGTGGQYSFSTAPSTQYTIEEAKTTKPNHGNAGFVVYPGANKMMFSSETLPTILSNNNQQNVAKDDRAYPEFYRAIYKPVLFTLSPDSHADLYKVAGNELTKVQTLAEGNNQIDLMADPEAMVYYIVPTDNSLLSSVGFADGTSVSEGFESLTPQGLNCDAYKIEIGRAYASYTVTTAPRQIVEITVNGQTAGSLTIVAGSEGNNVPAPALRDAQGNTIENVTYTYEVVDAEGNPFPEGEAPIAVDAEGNITVLKPGQAFVKVAISGEDAKRYDAEPVILDVTVVAPHAVIGFENGTLNGSVTIADGVEGTTVPTPQLTTDDDNEITGVTFKYEVIDPATGEPFAEGEAPITVDPATGEITTLKPGVAQVKVSLSDEDAERYDASPVIYDVKVTSPTIITGANGETEITIPVGIGSSADIPVPVLNTVRDGEETEVTGATFTYEVIDPSTGEPFAEGEAPVTVDATTGKVTAVKDGDAQIKVTLTGDLTDEYHAEPLIIDITAKNFVFVTYTQVSLEEINADEPVIFVSSKPVNSLGYVAPSLYVTSTGTTGNMPPVPVLSGRTSLPVELKLTVEQADSLRKYNVLMPAGGGTSGYGFKMLNGDKNAAISGIGMYIRSERNDRIRYISSQFKGYEMIAKNPGYAPKYGNFYLGFNSSGILTSNSDREINTNGANILFYQVKKAKANVEFKNSDASDKATLAQGENIVLPAVELTATGSDGQPVAVEGVTFKYEVVDAEGNPFPAGQAPVEVDENGNVTAINSGDARIKVTPVGDSESYFDSEPLYIDVTVAGDAPVRITYRKVNSVAELEQLAAENAGVIAVSARAFADKGFVAASTTKDANNNFLPVSILAGATELPAEFELTAEEADQLLSVYAIKQGNNFGFKLPAGHYLKRTINNKIVLTTAFHGYSVTDHKAAAKVRAANIAAGRAAESNDGFRCMTNNNYLGFVANGNLSHQNNGNVFTNGAAPAFFTINKVKAQASFVDGAATTPETLEKGESVAIPEVKLTTEQNGKTVNIDGVTYKYEVVDAEGNPIPAATSPISINPETGEITAVKGGDARVKITPADNSEMLYDAEPVYVDVKVPASDAKLVVDGSDAGTITIAAGESSEPVSVPAPTLVGADNNPIDAGNLTYTYEVVDANGNPYPAGQAPISVDGNGNITVKDGAEGQAFVRVSLSGDAANEYHADPYVYEVKITPADSEPVITIGDDDIHSIVIDKNTADAVIPTPELSVGGVRENDATFTYTVVDEEGNPFAPGTAPISVDPETGDITVVKPGIAKVIVALSDESAEHLGVDPSPVTIDVQVKDIATSIHDIETADNTRYLNLNGVRVDNPTPGLYIRLRGNKAEKVLIK